MAIPGFSAELSMYQSATTYAPGRGRRLVVHKNSIIPQQFAGLSGYRVNPVKPPWFCRLEYWLCRGFISTCTDRCVANSLYECALAPDPQACETALRMRCAASCSVACDAQYDACLRGQG
jgi:hypothetical protein